MPETDRTKYVTISKLTDMFKEDGNDVSEGTVRRWIKTYAEFFQTVRIDGWTQIEFESALPVLKKIKQTINIGKNRGGHDVRDALIAGFEQVTDTPPQSVSDIKVVSATEGENKMLVDLTPEAWERLEKLIGKREK